MKTWNWMMFLAATAAAISIFGCGSSGDDDDDDDDDDDVDSTGRYQECVDNIGTCTLVVSTTCELCPDNITDIFNQNQSEPTSTQDEMGLVYCHSCTKLDTGESSLVFYATNGCVDEGTILNMFCNI